MGPFNNDCSLALATARVLSTLVYVGFSGNLHGNFDPLSVIVACKILMEKVLTLSSLAVHMQDILDHPKFSWNSEHRFYHRNSIIHHVYNPSMVFMNSATHIWNIRGHPKCW